MASTAFDILEIPGTRVHRACNLEGTPLIFAIPAPSRWSSPKIQLWFASRTRSSAVKARVCGSRLPKCHAGPGPMNLRATVSDASRSCLTRAGLPLLTSKIATWLDLPTWRIAYRPSGSGAPPTATSAGATSAGGVDVDGDAGCGAACPQAEEQNAERRASSSRWLAIMGPRISHEGNRPKALYSQRSTGANARIADNCPIQEPHGSGPHAIFSQTIPIPRDRAPLFATAHMSRAPQAVFPGFLQLPDTPHSI